MKSLERTHIRVLYGNDLLREAQAARQIVVLVYRAVILNLVAEADRRQYRERDDGVQLARRHPHFRVRHSSHHQSIRLIDQHSATLATEIRRRPGYPDIATTTFERVYSGYISPDLLANSLRAYMRPRFRTVRDSAKFRDSQSTRSRDRIHRAPRYVLTIRASSRHRGSPRIRDNTYVPPDTRSPRHAGPPSAFSEERTYFLQSAYYFLLSRIRERSRRSSAELP